MNDLISKGKEDYKCYYLLKQYYNSNPDFKKFIDEGVKQNKIFPFDDELWKKLEEQNFRYAGKFTDYFEVGSNIGSSTTFSKQISYSFDSCTLNSGILPMLKGSPNCPEGVHCWMESDGYVYDTTFVIRVEKNYYSTLVSKLESSRDPNQDSVYSAAKEFTNDESLRR